MISTLNDEETKLPQLIDALTSYKDVDGKPIQIHCCRINQRVEIIILKWDKKQKKF